MIQVLCWVRGIILNRIEFRLRVIERTEQILLGPDEEERSGVPALLWVIRTHAEVRRLNRLKRWLS